MKSLISMTIKNMNIFFLTLPLEKNILTDDNILEILILSQILE